MANGVVREEFDKYVRLEKISRGWVCHPLTSMLLFFITMIPVLSQLRALGVNADDFNWRFWALAVIATVPFALHLFLIVGMTDRKVRELGAKVVNDYLGEGWLPEGASLDIFKGEVEVRQWNGQILKSTVREIIVGKGLWSTEKQAVALEFDDALRWLDERPLAV